MPENAEFPVSGKSVKSKLFSVSDCQSIVKKAIVERMKKHYKREGWFEENGPLFKIEVALHKDMHYLPSIQVEVAFIKGDTEWLKARHQSRKHWLLL